MSNLPEHIFIRKPPFYFQPHDNPEVPNILLIGFTGQGNAGKMFQWANSFLKRIHKCHACFVSSNKGGGYYGGELGGPFPNKQSFIDCLINIADEYNIEKYAFFGSSSGGGGALTFGRILTDHRPVIVQAFSPRFYPHGLKNVPDFFSKPRKYDKESEYHIHYDNLHSPDIPHVDAVREQCIIHNYPKSNHNTVQGLRKNGTLDKIIKQTMGLEK